ncbi:S-adenosyl-L-methionine-dependent methyltransferase [Syncephalis plumigaleata]|nr:S-adenosyl-L-methionine-dependent methyltransferase [Syncephalis plumigaleata]
MATFSNSTYNAAAYRNHRPTYMGSVYNTIMDYHRGSTDRAMDVATGTGQTAIGLSKLFTSVRATDKSRAMLSQAIPCDNIEYVQEPAEQMILPDKSINVITASTAAHWFDIDAFQMETRRVLTDNGTLAIWGYGVPVSLWHRDITEAILYCASVRLASYWDKGYGKIRGFYTNLELHDSWSDHKRFIWDKERIVDYWQTHTVSDVLQATERDELTAATTPIMSVYQMTLDDLASYLRTWSSYTNWKRSPNAQTEVDPVDEVIDVAKAALECKAKTQNGQVDSVANTIDMVYPHVLIVARK